MANEKKTSRKKFRVAVSGQATSLEYERRHAEAAAPVITQFRLWCTCEY